MGRGGQYAPKLMTIAVALVFVVIGVLGTFAHLLPDVAGYEGELIGVWSYIVATVILLVGIFFKEV